MIDHQSDNPPTLDYAPPPKRAMGVIDAVTLIVGTFGGIVSMVLLAVLFGTDLHPPISSELSRYVIAAIFFLLGIGAAAARLKVGRSSSPDRFLFMGICFGWFLTAMVAGACSLIS